MHLSFTLPGLLQLIHSIPRNCPTALENIVTATGSYRSQGGIHLKVKPWNFIKWFSIEILLHFEWTGSCSITSTTRAVHRREIDWDTSGREDLVWTSAAVHRMMIIPLSSSDCAFSLIILLCTCTCVHISTGHGCGWCSRRRVGVWRDESFEVEYWSSRWW